MRHNSLQVTRAMTGCRRATINGSDWLQKLGWNFDRGNRLLNLGIGPFTEHSGNLAEKGLNLRATGGLLQRLFEGDLRVPIRFKAGFSSSFEKVNAGGIVPRTEQLLNNILRLLMRAALHETFCQGKVELSILGPPRLSGFEEFDGPAELLLSPQEHRLGEPDSDRIALFQVLISFK